MSIGGSDDSISVVGKLADAKLTRRGFIGAAMSVPIAAQAEFLFNQAMLEPEHVDLGISDAGGLLKVAIQSGLSRDRRAFWSRLGVSAVRRSRAVIDKNGNETLDDEQISGPTWSIETDRFGPLTKVRFRNQVLKSGRRRYTVSLHDVSYGRVSDRTVRFIFDEHLELDTEGRQLFEDMQQHPELVGEVIKTRLKKLTVDDVPMRRVYTIRVATDIWSLRSAPTSKRWFELEPAEGYDATAKVGEFLRLDRWIDQAPTRRTKEETPLGFELLVDAGRITSTLKLVFNGQVGYEDRDAGRNVLLSFDQFGTWRVARDGVFLNALAPELQLSNFLMRWLPVGGEPLEDPPAQPENPAEDDGPDVQERAGPSAANEAFELVGWSDVAPGDAPLAFKGRGEAPGLTLYIDPDARRTSKVRFRILEPTQIEAGKIKPGQLRAEASLLTDWARVQVVGSAKAAAGPFNKLRGRLMERVDAPARMNDFDYAECVGNIGFGADFTGPASKHWRVECAIGPIGFRGPAPEDTVLNGDAEAAADDPFRQRHGDQVQAVFSWGRRKNGPFVPRRRPRTDWIEINGVLREAAVTLPGADFNRLTFAPTSLTLLFAPGELPPPQTSYIRLAAPKDAAEIAQFDLSDAALVAAKSDNLLGLTFRFGDLALSMQRDRTELVRRNASCRITTDRELDGSHDVRDSRPVLVVEFPGQHLFEEAFFRPNLQELPDVIFEAPSGSDEKHAIMTVARNGTTEGVKFTTERVFLTAEEQGNGWVLDPNDRQQVVDLLGIFKLDDPREKFRTALNSAKIAAEESTALAKDKGKPAGGKMTPRPFAALTASFAAGLANLPGAPADQHVYIGPYALDPDVMRVARKAWRQSFRDQLEDQANRLLEGVRDAAKALHVEANALQHAALTHEMRRIKQAHQTFEGALALEQRLETLYPSYQLFRTVYRDMVLDRTLKGAGQNIADLAPQRIEIVSVDALGITDGQNDFPRWMSQIGLTVESLQKDRDAARTRFIEALKGKEPVDIPARGRISNPSRLAFRVRCRDGISVARNRVETLDVPTDALAEEVRERLDFTLEGLTRFSDFELSVVRRAQAVYRPSEAGRMDLASRRRLDLSQGARLDLLEFSSGPFVTSGTRLGEVARSLKDPPHLRETAIEIPARLTLSPDQNAVVITRTGKIPDGIYCSVKDDSKVNKNSGCRPLSTFGHQPYVPLWSADFLVDEVDPNLRAVHSPDLRPDVFAARVQRKNFQSDANAGQVYPASAEGGRFPGASAPPRGPVAPWHLGAHETQTRALGTQNLENPLPTQPAISRLYAYLSGEKARLAAIKARDMKFRGAIDAYARHELVLLSSVWGLPVLGRRKPNGQLIADAGQSEPEQRYRLADVEHGSALYEPRTLQTIELSLTPIGGTLRHASSFEPFAAAFDSHGEALFDAASVESWQQWTNLGRDVHCEIVYKGFLWPIGQRASLVQVTEREFFIDITGAIRAALRQRLFIRVGKAEKLFPALKQPAQGRRFPVERLKNLTTQTPDIVDPSDDPIRDTNGAITLPGGRIQMAQGAKGLVFWPRTAKLPDANIRFELDLDGTLTDMPLIFVDNVAANDRQTLELLAAYYNDLPTPDPLSASDNQKDFDPITHVRTLDMGGGKRRYAAEKEAGSASAETQLWTLCATGLSGTVSQPEDTVTARVWSRQETIFRSDPVLQGADQPPFYPALECCRIRVRQAERLIGRPLSGARAGQVKDNRFLRAMPDAHFVEFGLPASTNANGPVQYAVEGNVAETYLALVDQLKLTMGDKGDNAGGIYRPSGHVVGLSRSRGVLTWSDRLDPTIPLACDRLLSVAKAFDIGEKLVPATPENGQAPKAENLPSLCTKATPVLIDPNIEQTIKDAQKLYSDIVDGNAKILGLVSIKQLFEFIEKLDPPSSGMPELAENAKYGAKEVQSAIGQVDDAVGDALSALDETVDLVRTTVIVPLAEAVHDIREGWNKLDRDIASFAGKVPAKFLGDISFAKIFPDLHCTLVAFDAALARAIGAADAIAFTLAVSEVFAAGRRFLDALFRAASDPGHRIEAGLRGGIEGILELINVLQERRAELVLELASSFLDDKDVIAPFAKIALYVSGQTDTLPPEVEGFAQKLVTTLIPETGGPEFLAIIAVPPKPAGVDQDLWNDLYPTADKARDVLRLMIILLIKDRGQSSLEDLLDQTRADFIRTLDDRLRNALESVRGWLGDDLTMAQQIRSLAIERVNSTAFQSAIAALPEPAQGQAKTALDEYRNLLAGFEGDNEAEVRNALKRWIKTGFSDEWNLFKNTERYVRQAVAGIEAGDFDRTFDALVRLAELHFGPMTGFERLCKETLEPFKEVAAAIYPGEDGIHAQLSTQIDSYQARVSALLVEVKNANDEIASVQTQLNPGGPIHTKVADLGSEAALNTLASARETVAGHAGNVDAAFNDLNSIAQSLAAIVADVKADAARTARFAGQFDKLANFDCKPENIGELAGLDDLHRDFRLMIDERRTLMMRLIERANDIFAAVESLVNNPTVQTASVVGAAAAVAEDSANAYLSVINLADFGSDIENAANTQIQSLKALQTRLTEQANAYTGQVVTLLLTYTDELARLLESARAMLRRGADQARPALIVQLEALLGADINGAVTEILGLLDEYIEWLGAVRTALEQVQTADDKGKALAEVKIEPVGRPTTDLLKFFQSPTEQGLANINVLNAIEDRLTEALDDLADHGAALFTKVSSDVVTLANDAITTILTTEIPIPFPELAPIGGKFTGEQGRNSLVGIYQQLLEFRNRIAEDETLTALGADNILFVPPDGRLLRDDPPKFEPYQPGGDKELDGGNDRLAGDVAWLTFLGTEGAPRLTINKEDPVYTFLQAFLKEWKVLRPTPVEIASNIENIVAEFLKGDLFAAIDFNDLRGQVEDYILSLVPTQIDMSYGYGVELGDKVRQATAGIFAPGSGSKLSIEAGIKIDLGFDKASVHARTVGRLDAFDVKLVGDAFDALTLKFNGATFTAETGKKMNFDISYSDYEIGPMLEFVQQFQSFLSPKGNSGFFLEPQFSPLGVEAGYILNLGDFSVGAMAISNVGLATSAILPFEDKDARFKASLSTRMSPFTITYTPYGGSGFFAIEANANGILGFEASFEFGGSAVFAFGPLTGQGRLMAGFYIRQSIADNGQKLTELSATFFVGGTAQIWIFSFAAALSVRLGMVNGNMSGEAIFSFSFSMGLADFEYSVVMFKREAKGFNGQQGASLRNMPFGRAGIRVADLNFNTGTLQKLSNQVPRVDTRTACQARDWRGYAKYFTDEPAGNLF